MLGILLVSASTFFDEIASSLGKDSVAKRIQTIYSMGFIQMFLIGLVLLAIIAIWPKSFSFSLASLPTFLPRLTLEVLQAHLTIVAITKADRSTFGMMRVLTVPLILLIDLALHYTIHLTQIIGMGLMVTALSIVFWHRGIQKAGIGFVLATAVIGSVSLSLYKYDITHFNSVVAEQVIVYAILLSYFFISAVIVSKERPFALLKKPVCLAQSLTVACSGILDSFAYQFAPASIIVAAKRSSAVLWSILSGNWYFKEQHLIVKLATFALLSIGIVLLVV